MQRLIFIFLFSILHQFAFASNDYLLTNNLKKAYQRINELKFSEAERLLAQEKRINPNNLMIDFVEDYIDFYALLVNGSTAEFKKRSDNKSRRLNRFNSGNIMSPYYLYSKAEIKIHWAIVGAQYGDQLTAFREMRSAYKLLQTNQKQFPSFMPNYKSLGTLRTIFSAIPDNYKWSAKALGINGSFSQGYRDITKALNYAKTNDFLFEEELRIIYAYILLTSKNDEDTAWKIINHSTINTKTSLLACFVKSDIAMRTGRNDEAISILENAPTSSAYTPVPQIDYFIGLAKLRKLDKSAKSHFDTYLKNKINDNYVKASYLNMAWYSLMFSGDADYNKYIQLCKSRGITVIYDDEKALKLTEIKPNDDILKAQLLYEGGYYNSANSSIGSKSESDFSRKYDKINYYYLIARIAHKENQQTRAIQYYQKTIDEGAGTTYFFSCFSALQTALIYEKQRNKSEASKWFNKCLSMDSDRHESSYHQQAKEGLSRLR